QGERVARLEVEPAEDLAEGAVTGRLGDQQGGALVLQADVGSEDRPDPDPLGGRRELDGPDERVAVGEGDGLVARLVGALQQGLRATDPFEQGVPGVRPERDDPVHAVPWARAAGWGRDRPAPSQPSPSSLIGYTRSVSELVSTRVAQRLANRRKR